MLREERRRARLEQRTARKLCEADFLAGVSDETRQGALRIWRDGQPVSDTQQGVPREIDIPRLLSLSDKAATDIDADVRDLFAAGSSLGGARPKASVRDERGVLHMAKFPKADETTLEDIPAWEEVALTLARDAGLCVSESRLLRVTERPVLLVRRFDRAAERIPYMSGITAVQGKDGGEYSYLELVEFLEQSGEAPEEDIRELWQRILFSCAIGNTDDHMRNHGFLRTKKGWRLSPLFDVNPTAGDFDKSLSTAIDFDTKDAEPEVALSVCEHFRYSTQEARGVAQEMAVVLSRWREVARRNGITPASIDLMASCFESGIRKLKNM